MRHFLGLVLIGLGVFLLAAAALVRFQIAPQLIAAPVDAYSKTVLRADNATYFDIGTLKVRTGATVTATNTTRGDVRASTDDTAVWDSFTAVQDLDNNVMVDMRQQRLAFDRRTSQLKACCGTQIQGEPLTNPSGLGSYWPVDLQKRDYRLYDATTRQAWPAKFTGEETLGGVKTYRFVQTIPHTKVPAPPRTLPGTLLGLDEDSGNVTADRYYQATVTYWVDPRTGAPVNQRQHSTSTLQAQQGPGRLVVADLDLRMTDASHRELLTRSDDGAATITTLKTTVPLVFLAAGLALVAGGLALTVRTRRGSRHRGDAPKA